jgi:DNA-binding NarL/FixJ family response regulator
VNICLVHGRNTAREVLARALSYKLGANVAHFACCENVLASSLDYDVFIVYNNFRKKMNGVRGVTEIRARKPDAFIIGVSSIPNFHRRFLPAGANAFLLKAGNEIEELARLVRRRATSGRADVKKSQSDNQPAQRITHTARLPSVPAQHAGPASRAALGAGRRWEQSDVGGRTAPGGHKQQEQREIEADHAHQSRRPQEKRKVKVCLAHGRGTAREVLARALSYKLGANVAHFACCENVLASSLDYDVFIVYNNFRKKMNGVRGVTEIRARKPDAFIIGVSSIPNFHRRFLPAGANAFLLKAGNEIEELANIIRRRVNGNVAANRQPEGANQQLP